MLGIPPAAPGEVPIDLSSIGNGTTQIFAGVYLTPSTTKSIEIKSM